MSTDGDRSNKSGEGGSVQLSAAVSTVASTLTGTTGRGLSTLVNDNAPTDSVPSTVSEPSPPQPYMKSHIPPSIQTKLEAGAFRRLCTHLRDRSDAVQNIDLMTVSGFCRNCLAKWLVMEARGLSDEMKTGDTKDFSTQEEKEWITRALDALGYDEAAEEVYGCAYADWKKQHAKKASEEQMQYYSESKPLHATHDKSLLSTRADKPANPLPASIANSTATPTTAPANKAASGLQSDVCCEDLETLAAASTCEIPKTTPEATTAQTPPPKDGISFTLGILTVSDRAFTGAYVAGDLSGPEIEKVIKNKVNEINSTYGEGFVKIDVVNRAVVPDEKDDISKTLKQWSSSTSLGDDMDTKEEESPAYCDLILTTGGTGFAPRDVTPEATLSILSRECSGLMSWAYAECSAIQPRSALSRGTAGICDKSMIVNLPGSPKGVGQMLDILFPLLLHAVKDLKY